MALCVFCECRCRFCTKSPSLHSLQLRVITFPMEVSWWVCGRPICTVRPFKALSLNAHLVPESTSNEPNPRDQVERDPGREEGSEGRTLHTAAKLTLTHLLLTRSWRRWRRRQKVSADG